MYEYVLRTLSGALCCLFMVDLACSVLPHIQYDLPQDVAAHLHSKLSHRISGRHQMRSFDSGLSIRSNGVDPHDRSPYVLCISESLVCIFSCKVIKTRLYAFHDALHNYVIITMQAFAHPSPTSARPGQVR